MKAPLTPTLSPQAGRGRNLKPLFHTAGEGGARRGVSHKPAGLTRGDGRVRA
jgi:hypothetical protein